MNTPSIRSVAVAAGFLGLTMIVAGTATAMAGSADPGAVGSGIALTHEDGEVPTPSPSPSSSGTALVPGTPIEIGADPLLTCDSDGTCGDDHRGEAIDTTEVTADAGTTAEAPVADVPPGKAATPGVSLAACEVPGKPAGPREAAERGDRGQMRDAVVAAAKACGADGGHPDGAHPHHNHAAGHAFGRAAHGSDGARGFGADHPRSR